MPRIDHVVVLMLENRSFDGMLGWLYPGRTDFDGLKGTEANPLHGPDGEVQEIPVWNDPSLGPEALCIPDPDPGELFDDINMQIYGLGRTSGGPATMSGFVDNYMRQNTGERHDPRAIMHCFAPEQVPALSTLARAFGVCDRWFGSAPCQTWPNRLFVHTGTADGRVNNTTVPLPFFLPTIFRRLDRRGHSWKVYFHDIPQTAAMVDLWPRIFTDFLLFEEEFADDAAAGRLPNYSFIEPRYFVSPFTGKPPNDQHPPHNILYGEQLIAAVYNAVRAGLAWERTLLLILFDEHGGCYDHVPPPAAIPPGGPCPDGFRFDRYGVRVPAVIVSPFVPPGSVIRPPEGSPPFDHTSILATLHHLFDLGPAPNPRVAAAPDLRSALTLETAMNHGPDQLDVVRLEGSQRLRRFARRKLNHHQRRLAHPLMLIPGLTAKAMGQAHHAAHRVGLRRRRKGV